MSHCGRGGRKRGVILCGLWLADAGMCPTGRWMKPDMQQFSSCENSARGVIRYEQHSSMPYDAALATHIFRCFTPSHHLGEG